MERIKLETVADLQTLLNNETTGVKRLKECPVFNSNESVAHLFAATLMIPRPMGLIAVFGLGFEMGYSCAVKKKEMELLEKL